MKLKKPQELQIKLKIYILFFLLISFNLYSQTKTKKFNFGISTGINHNDIHLGAEKITDRIFSNSKSKLTYNIGGLLSYRLEKIILIEFGAFYVDQEMNLNSLLLKQRTNNFFYVDKLYKVDGEAYFVNGKIKATSIVIPARLKIIMTPKTEKKLGLILGLHRQDNYEYNETGRFTAKILNIEKDYPNLANEVKNYLEERIIDAENLTAADHSKYQKTNNLGFFIGLNLDAKNFTLELNKHFNEIRPTNGPVYNFNFSSLNLRYWF